jgi:hypothetical protein
MREEVCDLGAFLVKFLPIMGSRKAANALRMTAMKVFLQPLRPGPSHCPIQFALRFEDPTLAFAVALCFVKAK